MQYGGVKATPSKMELMSMLKFEVLNNIDYYGAFVNYKDTDFVEDLESYIKIKRYSSGTIEGLVMMGSYFFHKAVFLDLDILSAVFGIIKIINLYCDY